MAITYTNLKSLFTDIADAIREKTGKTDTIVANDFPNEIASISTGFPNGTEWFQSNCPSGYFNKLYYANGTWLADSSTEGCIYYSKDGITWNQSRYASDKYVNLCHANGLWVLGSGTASRGLYYSTDGRIWTQSNITSGACNSICNGNGIWVASNTSSSNGLPGIYISTDGKTWSQSNMTSGGYTIYYANGIWVASGTNGTYYSMDAMT